VGKRQTASGFDSTGYVIFDDTVSDKQYARNIALVRRQYSGNAHGLINSIGVVICGYVNPVLDRFWVIDYRIYDPQGDGKNELEHLKEVLSLLVYHKKLPFQEVLIDGWYACKALMLQIEKLQKNYYCPLKTNRLVDDSLGRKPYQRIETLAWTQTALKEGKRINIRGFPKDHNVKVFRVASSTGTHRLCRANDLAQKRHFSSTTDV